MAQPFKKIEENKEERKELYAKHEKEETIDTGAKDSYAGERCEHDKLEGDCPDCNEMSDQGVY